MNFGGGGIGVGNDNERVDLEVGELRVDVDGVEADDEVEQDIVDTLRDVLQERLSQLLMCREFLEVNWDKDLLGLLVNITDIDTTLVGEEDPVTLVMLAAVDASDRLSYVSDGVDVDVVLSLLRMRHERLDKELSQITGNVLDLLLLARSLLNPGSRLGPGLVQAQ